MASWKDIEASEAYTALDGRSRGKVRKNYFNERIAPHESFSKLDKSVQDKAQSRWMDGYDTSKTREDEPVEQVAMDYAGALGKGLSGVGQLIGRGIDVAGNALPDFDGIDDNNIVDRFGQYVEGVYKGREEKFGEQQSVEFKKEQEKTFGSGEPGFLNTFTGGEAWSSPEKIVGGLVESSPSTALGMFTGGRVIQGMKSAGVAVSPWLSGLIGSASGEGALSAAQSSKSIYDDLMSDNSKAQMRKSDEYREAMSRLGNDHKARKDVASNVAQKYGAATGILTSLTGVVSGKFLDDIIGKKFEGSLAKAMLKGATLEAPEEAIQSGFEQVVQNIANGKFVDPDVEWYNELGEVMPMGAITGGAMGAGVTPFFYQKPGGKIEPVPKSVVNGIEDILNNKTPVAPIQNNEFTQEGDVITSGQDPAMSFSGQQTGLAQQETSTNSFSQRIIAGVGGISGRTEQQTLDAVQTEFGPLTRSAVEYDLAPTLVGENGGIGQVQSAPIPRTSEQIMGDFIQSETDQAARLSVKEDQKFADRNPAPLMIPETTMPTHGVLVDQNTDNNASDQNSNGLDTIDPITRAENKKKAGEIVREDPIYKAMAQIKLQGGINKESFLRDYDKDIVKAITKKYPGLVRDSGKVNIDEVATELDFKDGESLYTAMAGAKTIKDATAEARQKLDDEYLMNVEGSTAKLNRETADNVVGVIKSSTTYDDLNTLRNDLQEMATRMPEMKGFVREFNKELKRKSKDLGLMEDFSIQAQDLNEQENQRVNKNVEQKAQTAEVETQTEREQAIAKGRRQQKLSTTPAGKPKSFPDLKAYANERELDLKYSKLENERGDDKTGTSILNNETGRAYILEDLSNAVYKAGMKFKEFATAIRKKIGKAYGKYRPQIKALFSELSKPVLNEVGAVGKDITNFFAKQTTKYIEDMGYSDSINYDRGTVKVFHGSSPKSAKNILKTRKFNGYPFFAFTRDKAKRYGYTAITGGSPKVIEVNVRLSDVLPTGEYLSSRVDNLSMSEDGVWGEVGTISEDVKFSKVTGDKNLIVLHNLTPDNIKHISKNLGGKIPVPSLAITKKESPLKGFGDISLVGSKELIEPSGTNKVFGADAYTPRYPEVENKVNSGKVRSFADDVYNSSSKIGLGGYIDESILKSKNWKERLRNNTSVQAAYLDHLGDMPRKRMKDYDFPLAKYNSNLLTYSGVPVDELVRNDDFINDVKKALGEKDSRLLSKIDGNGYLMDGFASLASKYTTKKSVDKSATREAVEKRIATRKNKKGFNEYLESIGDDIIDGQQIFKGFNRGGTRKLYTPATIDNIVKIMKKNTRGGESFNYGLNSVKALQTPQFRSIAEIKKSERKLMDEESFQKIWDEINEDWNTLLVETEPSQISDVNDAIIAAAEGDFSYIEDSSKAPVREFLQKLNSMPSKYFEAKINRAVDLGEFSGAVVPRGTDKETIKILKNSGLTVRYYTKGDQYDKARAVGLFKGALFAKMAKGKSTTKQATREARKFLGTKGLKNWQDNGTLKIVATEVDLDGDMRSLVKIASQDGATIAGYFNPADGSITVIAGNNPKGGIKYLLSHEGGHLLLATDEKFIADKEKLLKRFDDISQYSGKGKVALRDKSAAQRAFEKARRAEPNGNTQLIQEEALMYFLQDRKNQDIPLYRKIVAKIRSALRRLGYDIGKMNNDDLVELFVSGIRANARGENTIVGSINEFAQPIKASVKKATENIKGMDDFKKWFGDSKVVGKIDEPLVVYHGTSSKFTEFDPAKIGKTYNVDNVGFFFSSTKDEAEYSGKESAYKSDDDNADTIVMPAYLSLENPLVITAGVEYDAEFGKGNAINTFDQNKDLILEDIEENNHDGLIVKGVDGEADLYMAIKPEQIKSIYNQGKWNRQNPDIMKSLNVKGKSPQFNKWFKDSKITDESGEPMKLYHGSAEMFTGDDPANYTFDKMRLGTNTEHTSSGLGFFFTPSKPLAKKYAEDGQIAEVNISMQNPYKMTIKESQSFDNVGEAIKRRAELMREGYDGVIIQTGDAKTDYYITFESSQSKSTDNKGYGPTGDIRFSKKTNNPTLYHGTNGEIESIDPDYDYNRFGGIFASDSYEKASSHGDTVKEILVSGEVATSQGIDNKKSMDKMAELLSDYVEDISDSEIAEIYEIAIADGTLFESDISEQRLLDIFQAEDIAEADWALQGYKGKMAKENGFNAVEIVDEHGTSYLVTEGNVYKSDNTIKLSKYSKEPTTLSGKVGEHKAITGTENMNASYDGYTSNSLVETGRQEIRLIFNDMKVALGTKAAGLKYSDESLAKVQVMLNKAMGILGDTHKSIAEKEKFISTLGRKLPKEIRSELLVPLSKIARFKTDKAIKKRTVEAIHDAKKVLAKHYVKVISQKIEKAIQAPKLGKNRVRKGKGKELENTLKHIREIIGVDVPTAEKMFDNAMAEIKTAQQDLNEATDDNEIKKLEIELVSAQDKAHHIEALASLKNKNFDDVVSARNYVEFILKEGRSKFKANREAYIESNREDALVVRQEITGKENPQLEEQGARKRRQDKQRESFMHSIYRKVGFMSNGIQSFETMLDKLTAKSGLGPLGSKTVEKFGSLAHAATQDKAVMLMDSHDKIRNKAEEIWGNKVETALTDASKPKDGIIHKYNEDGSIADTIPMSEMDAAYWYLIARRRSDNDSIQKTFYNQKITEQTLKDINNFMSPEVKQWADWIMDNFLDDFYAGINNVYSELNGIDLSRGPNYIPMHREVAKKNDTEEPGFLGKTQQQGGLQTGSLKETVSNTNPFKVMNLNTVLMNHVEDMTHYKAWAIPSIKMNAVLDSPAVRATIEQYHGQDAVKTISKFLEDFVSSDRDKFDKIPGMDKIRANVTIAMVGLNPVVVAKQLTSIPAMAADIPIKDWGIGTVKAMSNIRGSWKFLMENSPLLKARGMNGYDKEMQNLAAKDASRAVAGKKKLREWSMVGVQFGDKAAIIAGGKAVYDYYYKQAIKAGKTENEAKKIGIAKFEQAFERSQQSANTMSRGSFLRGGSIQNMFTMFMTAPASYSRMLEVGIRGLVNKGNRAQAFKTTVIYGVVLPMVFQAVADAMLGIDGDDEEKKAFLENQYRAVAMSYMNGLPLIRDMQKMVVNVMQGNGWYRDQFSPVASIAYEGKDALSNFLKFVDGGTSRISKEEYQKRFLENITHTVGYGFGIPTKPAKRLGIGFTDVQDDNVIGNADKVRSYLGYSRKKKGYIPERFASRIKVILDISKEYGNTKDVERRRAIRSSKEFKQRGLARKAKLRVERKKKQIARLKEQGRDTSRQELALSRIMKNFLEKTGE